MSRIAGIVYSNHDQIDNLINPMLNTLSFGAAKENETVSYKNIQLGVCGNNLLKLETIVIGLDGQIFNKKELCEALQSEGCTITEKTCTALIAHAYHVWGISFLKHIQGEFAFFILDKKKHQILLGRDHIGKKPLYWFQDQHHFIFGSEIKALLATGVVPQTPAMDAIASYLYFGYIPQDMSPIQNINKLLPSHYLLFDEEGSKIIHPYWSYSSFFTNRIDHSPTTIITNFDRLFESSIKENIPDQGPFGCWLSGGLGSASVAYYLQKCSSKERITAYTVGFQNEQTADMEIAKEVAAQLHLKHTCDVITPETFLKDLVKIIWHLDEPIADPNIIHTWKLAALSRPSKIAFSGMGSDELLVGHNRYTIEDSESSLLNFLILASMPIFKTIMIPILNLFYKTSSLGILQHGGTLGILQHVHSNPRLIAYLNQNALFSTKTLAHAAPRIADLIDPHIFLHKFYNLTHVPSTVSSFLYLDIKTRLADCLILQCERLTAAHGVDWRTPYLSQPILEYLASIALPDKLSEKETSFILKMLLANELPTSVVNRPKKTRRDFLSSWMEKSELANLFQLLPQGMLVESNIISEKWLRHHLDTPEHRRESFRYLWSLLVLEIWFRLYINLPIQPSAPEISVMDLFKELK